MLDKNELELLREPIMKMLLDHETRNLDETLLKVLDTANSNKEITPYDRDQIMSLFHMGCGYIKQWVKEATVNPKEVPIQQERDPIESELDEQT